MRYAILSHPEQWITDRLALSPICLAEACVPAAVAQGWIVLARDSACPVKHMDLPAQSNPRRRPDDDTERI